MRTFLGSMAAHTCASASCRHILYPTSPAVVLQCLVSTEALTFPWRHDIQHCCMAAASWVCRKGMMCLHPSLLRGLPDVWILISRPMCRHPMSTQGCSVSVFIHCTDTWPCLGGFPFTMEGSDSIAANDAQKTAVSTLLRCPRTAMMSFNG